MVLAGPQGWVQTGQGQAPEWQVPEEGDPVEEAEHQEVEEEVEEKVVVEEEEEERVGK